ncbi:WD40 repeat domain-containing protein [Serratia proteamaculans]|uniref:WD40 repeat domain-containing protein n=1 Tax=Serratia proteamaculans TaxID=28151 RepID=UPI003CFC490E
MMYHTSPISGIATNNTYVATAGYDNKVILWDAQTHLPLSVSYHDHLANQVTFSPDGRFVASSSSDYSLRIWSVPDLQLHAVMRHDDDVEGISFHPNQPWVATASRDRHVRVFDLQGKLLVKLSGHDADVISVEWKDDDILISSGDDGTIRYWSFEKQKQITIIDMAGVETDTLCLTKEGLLVSGDDEGCITIFDAQGRKISHVEAHQSGVKRLIVKNNTVISLSYDRYFKIWNLSREGLNLVHQDKILPQVWPRSSDIINDRYLVFVTFGDRYAIYDLQQRLWLENEIKDTYGINAVCANGNDILFTGDAGKLIRNGTTINQLPSLCNFIIQIKGVVLQGGQDGAVYNGETGQVVYQHHSPLNCQTVLQHTEGTFVLVGAYTGEVILLRVEEGGHVQWVQNIQTHKNAIKGMAINGTILFTACADHSVSAHDLTDFTQPTLCYTGTHDMIVNGCVALEEGFASISRDKTLRLWSTTGEQQVIISPHQNSIKCINYAPGQNLIMSGDYRGAVAIYDLTQQRWTMVKKISTAGISCITFDITNNRFIASSYLGELHLIPTDMFSVQLAKDTAYA